MHVPVLIKEILGCLDPKPNENFIDGTVGQAGHALMILEKTGPQGKLLGIDADPGQIANAAARTAGYGDRVILVNDSYANIKQIAKEKNFEPVHGILLDLGYSSWQLEQSGKGFSFLKDEKLDMRYDTSRELTAEKIVNHYPEAEIEKILKEYGEETFARKIAKEITAQRTVRKIETTFQLKNIIESVVPKKFQHGRIHCATKTFQALRIAVNDELNTLQKALPDAAGILAPGGRLAVISFHSLEDRIVKNFFNQEAKRGSVKIVTQKPIAASSEELVKNPRARSAKLRSIIKK